MERIADLEKRVAQLEQDRDTMDTAIREAFVRTGDILTRLVEASNDAQDRIARLERVNRSE